MARVEITTAPAELIGSQEQVKAVVEAVKITEIEPTTEKVTKQEASASSPLEEDPVAEKTVDVSSVTVEKPAEKLIVTPPVPEHKAESAAVESQEAEKHKCEALQVPQEGELFKEVPVEAEGVEAATKNDEGSSGKEEASAAVVMPTEEKAEESLVKEEAFAEIPEEKVESV